VGFLSSTADRQLHDLAPCLAARAAEGVCPCLHQFAPLLQRAAAAVAVAESGRAGSVEYLGEIANDSDAINKLCDRLGRSGKQLAFCYEAAIEIRCL